MEVQRTVWEFINHSWLPKMHIFGSSALLGAKLRDRSLKSCFWKAWPWASHWSGAFTPTATDTIDTVGIWHLIIHIYIYVMTLSGTRTRRIIFSLRYRGYKEDGVGGRGWGVGWGWWRWVGRGVGAGVGGWGVGVGVGGGGGGGGGLY